MILHIPHASERIPEDIGESFLLKDSQLDEELLRMTDTYTDELYNYEHATRVVFPVSRLVK